MSEVKKVFCFFMFFSLSVACNSNSSSVSAEAACVPKFESGKKCGPATTANTENLKEKPRSAVNVNVQDAQSNALNAKPILPTKIQDVKTIAQSSTDPSFTLASRTDGIYEYLSGLNPSEQTDYFSINQSIMDLTRGVYNIYRDNNIGAREKNTVCESSLKILQLIQKAKSGFQIPYETLIYTYGRFEEAAMSAKKDSCESLSP